MKILFVIYQLDFADHIAIPYLSAQAKQRGHDCELCIVKDESLVKKIGEYQPDLVAFSANIYGFEQLIAAHKEARQQYDYVSNLGGPQATFSPETFEESGMDSYIIGEGDEAFADLLECLEQGQPYDHLDNFITAKGVNPVRPLVRDLDSLPFPDRDITLKGSYLAETPKKTFYATRGCPYSCAYCCNDRYHKLYKGKGPIVRRFSVDRLLDEIEYVQERYRMEFVKFGDDLFAPRLDSWLEEFCEKYPKRIGVPFNIYLRFDTVTRPMLKLLKGAGCYSAHLSVDSVSPIVREQVLNRRMAKVDIVEQLLLFKEAGINTWVNYMLAAPESTLQNDLDTIEVSRKAKVTYPAYSTTVCMKGTSLYEYAESHGLIDPGYCDDMTGITKESALKCFSDKEKQVRLNVFLLGAITSKLPYPLFKLAMFLIKNTKPNQFYRWLRQKFYIYSIENTIFRLHSKQ